MATGELYDKMHPNYLDPGFRLQMKAESGQLCTDSMPLKIVYSP